MPKWEEQLGQLPWAHRIQLGKGEKKRVVERVQADTWDPAGRGEQPSWAPGKGSAAPESELSPSCHSMSPREKLDPLPDTFILQPPVFHPVSTEMGDLLDLGCLPSSSVKRPLAHAHNFYSLSQETAGKARASSAPLGYR